MNLTNRCEVAESMGEDMRLGVQDVLFLLSLHMGGSQNIPLKMDCFLVASLQDQPERGPTSLRNSVY